MEATIKPATAATEERPLRCPACKLPRFIVGIGGEASGTIRVICPKCREHVTFDLATGEIVRDQSISVRERDLRCGKCRWFLAGMVASGSGYVRIPCARTGCKRNNKFDLEPRRIHARVAT